MDLIYYKTIDDFLGEKTGRYFGSGYINTKRSISDFSMHETTGNTEFSCEGVLDAPELWSIKGDQKQKIHLSSIDAIEFAIKCAQAFLECMPKDSEFSSGSIEKLTIAAGKEPVEEGLESIRITGKLHATSEGSSLLRMNIANMQADLTLSTGNSKNACSTGNEAQPISVDDVMVNREMLIASAVASPVYKNQDENWSLSNSFAAMAQLGQTLLYKLDNIPREASDTLWMRKFSIAVSHGMPLSNMPQPIHVGLKNIKKLRMESADWRCADVCSMMGNINIVCKIAHRIS
ncbi:MULTISPECIES: AvrD family protein [Ralstonia solanacearum species complex]|uniref:AvrD family protein n=1 Tax=Ralstonia solanacearum species complex TaxID=3116862 RepID=UPI000E57F2AD|nr:AvrD family protein [Ralstonia solanacearum]BEU72817.1 AvrD family protein [Ralstonia pseudosolanacearum]AXV77648.1 avirulence d protein [Ralstonia solanacearum]AXV91670.1 avirulence d protein [Ralstonia solanacearum]AXW19781.1 avirulence d protein [Ralstonia solanacearum]AXW76561.1 avirulence d protein [Ralstonia solanacearum]